MEVKKRLFKLKGKLDGVAFFESLVKLLARMAYGSDKRKILADGLFERTRENNEFTESALAATTLTTFFAPVMSIAIRHYAPRLIDIFKRMNLHRHGVRDKRHITMFQFNEELYCTELNVSHVQKTSLHGK